MFYWCIDTGQKCDLDLDNPSALLQENFLTPSVFGEIIYENYLFDIPKILDLCVLFGKGNTQLLHKMIGKLIMTQILKNKDNLQ